MISTPNIENVGSSRIRRSMLRSAPRTLEPLISSLPVWVNNLDLCRISIQGIEHVACIDNQASCNVLSLRFALEKQIAMEPVNVPFTLGDGSRAYATGRVLVHCIARGVHFPTCEFYIVPKCIQPIILGRPFLYESGLLKCPRHIASEPLSQCRQKGTARHPVKHHCASRDHRFQSQIGIQFGLKEAHAVPDKASNQNFMSLAYAQALGFSIDEARHSQDTVTLANGAKIRCRGHIEMQFKIRRTEGQAIFLRDRFTVIDGHPFDLSVGNTFVKRYKVFGENVSEIEWTHVDEDNLFLCPTFGSSKDGKGIFARKLEFTNDFQDDEMTCIASRSSKSRVIRTPPVAPPQIPVAPAVQVTDPPDDVAVHGVVNHESTTAPQSNGIFHGKSKHSTKKTHGLWLMITGH